MEDDHVLLCHLHLFAVKDVAVLEADVVLFVEEPFLLDACHVEDVQVSDNVFHPFCSSEFNSGWLKKVFGDVFWNLKFFRADENKLVVLVAAHGLCK